MGLTRTRFIQANTALAKIQDPITVLNSDSTVANVDVGFLINRDSGVQANVAIYWSESGTEFVTALTANTGIPDANIVVLSYADFKVGNLYANIGGGNDQANVYITGSLIPSANVAYDLGTETNRFRSLWVSGNTIYIGKESISVDGEGTWSFSSGNMMINMGENVPFNSPSMTTGNLTVTSNLTVQGTQFIANTTDVSFVDSQIELHTQANLAPLTSDDGRDIGLKFHYYKTQDEHAFLGWANDSGYLEWYDSGREGVGNVFTGNTYGTVKTGGLILTNTTISTSTTTGALRVSGGVGIEGNLYINNVGDVSANVGTLRTNFNTLDANVGVIKTDLINLDANVGTILDLTAAIDANIGTIKTDLGNLEANVGSYQLYANANIGTIETDLSTLDANVGVVTIDLGTLDANVGSYQVFTNTYISIIDGDLTSIEANVGAYQLYANANIGTIKTNLSTLDANVGAYQIWANANVSSLQNQITAANIRIETIDANIGSFQLYANATFGTTYSNANVAAYLTEENITSANIGSFQLYANANIGTIKTDLDTLDANVGSYQLYANANIGTIKTDLSTLDANVGTIKIDLTNIDANVGSYQLYANANIGTIKTDLTNLDANVGTIKTDLSTLDANVGAYQIYANANIGSIKTDFTTLDANVGSFEAYANTKIGTNSGSNLVVVSATTSTSGTTGALVVGGGVGVAGNVYADKVYTTSGLYWAGNGDPAGGGVPGGVTSELQFNNSGSFGGANILFNSTNGNVVVTSATNSSSNVTGALVVEGGVGVKGNVTLSNTVVGGKLIVSDATNAEPYVMGSGAFHVVGGMSIGKDFWVGGNIYVANVISQTSTILEVNDPLVYLDASDYPYNYDIGVFSDFIGGSANIYQYTGAIRSYQTNEWVFFSNLQTPPGAGIVSITSSEVILDPIKVGNLVVANTTVSVDTNTGALIVKGGAGISSRLNVGGNIVAASGVNATNYTTGAIVVPNGGGVGITGDLWVQGPSTFGGNIVAGNIQLSGNINVPVGGTFSNTGTFFGNAGGVGALYAGTSTYTPLPTTVLQMTGNVDTYVQVNFQNLNSGTGASTDFVLTADNGTDEDGYINLGINSSTFDNPDYPGFYPNDGYLIHHGIEPAQGNLVIMTHAIGTAIKFHVGTFGEANVRATVTNEGFRVNTSTISTSTTTGALIVDGGAGIGGNIFADSVYTTNGVYWSGNGNPYSPEPYGNANVKTYLESLSNVNIGLNAGIAQAQYATAVGNGAGSGGQGQYAVALGPEAGFGNQGEYAIAIGYSAAYSLQGNLSVALGYEAGNSNQNTLAVAIGPGAGKIDQGFRSVAIGNEAGYTAQGNLAVAIGPYAGNTAQQDWAVAIGSSGGYGGYAAGGNNQGYYGVAIGSAAGSNNQGYSAVAIGDSAGGEYQSYGAVAIGQNAGYQTQDPYSIAIGFNAGNNNQGSTALALGLEAGETNQGNIAIALGERAGETAQGDNSIAIGQNAGADTQSSQSIAIGTDAGRYVQGTNAIAIGLEAGYLNQAANSIVISTQRLDANTSGFFVDPIRNLSSGNVLYYNPTTKEITYSGGGSGSPGGNNNEIQFNNGGLFGGANIIFNSAEGNLAITSTTTSTSITTGALVVGGGVGIAGTLYIANTGDVSANLGAYQTFANANVSSLQDQITGANTNIQTTNANLGAYQTFANANVSSLQDQITGANTNIQTTNANIGSFQTYANTKIGTNADSNLVVVATTTSTSTTTGALVVAGGAGISGALYTGGIIDATGNIIADSGVASTSSTTGALVVNGGAGISGNIFTAGWIIPSSNVSQNLGSNTSWWNLIYGRSVQAQYADLAENYTGDYDYAAGTVVVFGGAEEVTTSNISHDSRAAGVVSTNPAYLMNAVQGNVSVALTGRVPTLVRGPIVKGSQVVTSDTPGVGQALDLSKYIPGCVIGKSLENILDDSVKLIEVVVGRL